VAPRSFLFFPPLNVKSTGPQERSPTVSFFFFFFSPTSAVRPARPRRGAFPLYPPPPLFLFRFWDRRRNRRRFSSPLFLLFSFSLPASPAPSKKKRCCRLFLSSLPPFPLILGLDGLKISRRDSSFLSSAAGRRVVTNDKAAYHVPSFLSSNLCAAKGGRRCGVFFSY